MTSDNTTSVSEATSPDSPRRTDWLAESIRATIFPAPASQSNPEGWWRTLTGRDPETLTVRQLLRERNEEGPFNGGILGLQINAVGIIQWLLGPRMTNEPPSDLPNIGPFQDAVAEFRGLIYGWFADTAPLASRLAFGASALLPVPNKVEAYRMLAMLLPAVQLDPVNSTDFLYRINRPRPSRSGVPGLEINRLSTWMSVHLQLTTLPIGASGPSVSVSTQHACRVDLDINTTPSFQGRFEGREAADVFQELIDLGLELMAEGERP